MLQSSPGTCMRRHSTRSLSAPTFLVLSRTLVAPSRAQTCEKAANPLSQRQRCCRTSASSPSGAADSVTAAAQQADQAPSILGLDEVTARAWTLLRDFSKQQVRGTSEAFLAVDGNRGQLRDALQVVVSRPCGVAGWDPDTSATGLMLGVLAGDGRMAMRAYRDWCDAFGQEFGPPKSRVDGVATLGAVQGPVYIKFVSANAGGYFSSHFGKDRGVLLQLGTDQLGLFPLGLWDEAMTNPAPKM